MRPIPLALFLLTASSAAFAQDAAPPAPAGGRPTGTMLLDALPVQADIVVDVPDLPALLASGERAGLGDAAVWRAAFVEQLRTWNAGLPNGDKLVKGGGDLLAAADGEVLLASIEIRIPSEAGPSERATLFAMRSTRDEKTLRAALQGVIDGGLRYRYEGEPNVEQIGGRRVTALPGVTMTLYFSIQDGFLAASDHALALGLFFRGLARETKQAPTNRPAGDKLTLLVRHGRGDAAWEGWIWGEGETVQWKTDKIATADLPTSNAVSSVFGFAMEKPGDVPLSPVPLDDVWVRSILAYKPTDAPAIGIFAERSASGSGAPSQAAGPRETVPGAAWRLGWLRSLGSGRIKPPFPAIAFALLRAPYESAVKLAGAAAGEFIPWKSTEPGKISGPLGHGPATLLALRALHDIGHSVAPRALPPKAPDAVRELAPLPPPAPTESKDR